MTQSIARFPHTPGYSARTSQLIDFLKAATADIITDEELAAACGGESAAPGGKAYNALQSAIRHVLRDGGVVWRRMPGTHAIKRLAADETAELAATRVRHVRRVTRRGVREASTVNPAVLPDEARRAFLAKFAQLGTLAAFSDEKTAKALVVREATAPPDMEKMLSLFNGSATA